jgi:glycosyltransferase involved in cell wall biosynthesis
MSDSYQANSAATLTGADSTGRVALVTNVLSHYRVPCFEALSRDLGERLTIFLLSQGMEHRRYIESTKASNLPLVALPGLAVHLPPNDDKHLNDLRPVMRGDFDVVILCGWDEPSYLLLWLWLGIRRKRILFWIESTAVESATSGLKGRYKRLLLSRSSGCIVPGQRSAALCRALGVDDQRIFVAPNAADRQFFSSRASALLPQRTAIRSELDVRPFTVLLVGRLVEQYKGVSTLIEACAALEERNVEVSLLVAGDGPDRDLYESLVSERRLSDARFLGILNHESLCKLYAAADVLVVPSRSEPWGFVLNEAMEFDLPVVVSDAVGAGPDLVQPGENGFVVQVGDSEALAQALFELASDPDLCARMGSASGRLIARFNPRRWADGVLESITGRE